MKKTTFALEFAPQKMEAIHYYLSKKELSIQNELLDSVQKLYEKHVPQVTREYLEDQLAKERKPKSKQSTSTMSADTQEA